MHLLRFPRNPAFTGRLAQLDELGRWLRSPEGGAPFMAISGGPGVGKTQLANALSHAVIDTLDAVLWLDADSGSILQPMADASRKLGLVPGSDVSALERADALRMHLQNIGAHLIVLDNVVDVRLLEEGLLPTSPHTRVLVTTRLASVPQALNLRLLPPPDDEALEILGVGDAAPSEVEAARHLIELFGNLPLLLGVTRQLVAEGSATFAGLVAVVEASGVVDWSRDIGDELAFGQLPYVGALLEGALACNPLRPASQLGRDLLMASAWLDPSAVPLNMAFEVVEHLVSGPLEPGQRLAAVREAVRFSLASRLDPSALTIHRVIAAWLRSRDDGEVEASVLACIGQHLRPLLDAEHVPDLAAFEPTMEAVSSFGRPERQVAQRLEVGLVRLALGKLAKVQRRHERAEAELGPIAEDPPRSEDQDELRQLQAVALLELAANASYSRSEDGFRLSYRRIFKARGILVELHGEGSTQAAWADLKLAQTIPYDGGQFGRAETILRDVLRTQRNGGCTSDVVGRTVYHLGHAVARQRRHAEAVRLFEEALELRASALPADSVHRAGILHARAYSLMRLGRVDEARADMQRALEIRQRSFGPRHPVVATSFQNLGDFWLRVARDERDPIQQKVAWEQAAEHYLSAVSILEATYGAMHGTTLMACAAAGSPLARIEPARAIPLLQRVVDAPQGAINKTNRITARFDHVRARFKVGEKVTRQEVMDLYTESKRVNGRQTPMTSRIGHWLKRHLDALSA